MPGGSGSRAPRESADLKKAHKRGTTHRVECEPTHQRVFNVEWDHEYIEMPVVNPQKQRRPSFTGDVVTAIVENTDEQKYRVLFALLASSGLRFGEALGLNINNISPDCSTIKIVQKAWGSEVQDRLKTVRGEREVDLHPDMAGMLREFIGDRNSGLLFVSRRGRPLHQSSVLRRKLHPILAKLGQPKCGVHAFRRFRNTYLRNFTATPPGVLQFWMGRRGYVRPLRQDQIERGVSQRNGRESRFGFRASVQNPRYWTETRICARFGNDCNCMKVVG